MNCNDIFLDGILYGVCGASLFYGLLIGAIFRRADSWMKKKYGRKSDEK